MRRPWPIVLVITLGLAVTFTACAKRPLGSQASVPPPSAAQSSTPSTGSGPSSGLTTAATPPGATAQPGRSDAAPPTTASPPRPPLLEFAENPALRDVYFDFDKYSIRLDAARTLESNATWLKSNPNVQLLIEGHCDERGTNEYNLALGERRARSTMNYLVAQGIQAARMTIISYGEERPACREHNDACWSRNRRAHFLTRGR